MLELAAEFSLALLLLTGVYVARWWRTRIPRHQNVPEALRRASKTQLALNRLQHAAKSQRVSLCQAKNGGSLLEPSEPWYSTMLYEVAGDTLGPKQEGWVSQPIDGPYRHLLHEAFENGQRTFYREELPRCILRNLFDRDKVECGVMAIVTHNPGKVFYLTLEFSELLTEDERPVVAESVRGAVVELRQLLKVK